MSTPLSSFRRFAAVLVGIVFLCSGLLKIIDPVGTMLIVREYMKFFHFTLFFPIAKVLGIALATTEALVGVALITGVFRKSAALLTYAMLIFFTVVTFFLWVFNPVMDCGCFGEAIHLTHAQSFFKNIALIALSVFAFTPFKEFGVSRKDRRVSAVMATLAVLFAVYYSNTHLPIVDFTAFDWGAELLASTEGEVAEDNHYQASFIYEKDGRRKSFTLDALPDSSWVFVGVDSLARGAAFKDEYPVLSFRNKAGEYLDHLAAQGRVVVISVYDARHARWEQVEWQYRDVAAAGATPLVITSASPSDVPPSLPAYFADYKTLITLNRSNGGGSYFCDGELVNKWDARHVPDNLEADFRTDPVTLSSRSIVNRRLKAQGYCVLLAAVLLLI